MPTLPWPAAAPGKGELAKLRLLDAATRVFGEKGLKGATVREIARAAGQNVASIAYHFGSKESLYRAVLQRIVRLLRNTTDDMLREITASREAGRLTKAESLRLLQELTSEFYLRVLSRSEAIWVGRLIVREQTQPSPAFEILYNGAFREIHETLCLLVGTALGQDPRHHATILRAHSLMGQVWFFAVSRETILRRLGWRTLGGRNAEAVVRVLAENIQVMLQGLGQATTCSKL